jgi:hypothetical protein
LRGRGLGHRAAPPAGNIPCIAPFQKLGEIMDQKGSDFSQRYAAAKEAAMTLSSLMAEDSDSIMSMADEVTGKIRQVLVEDPDEAHHLAEQAATLLSSLLERQDYTLLSSSIDQGPGRLRRILREGQFDETDSQLARPLVDAVEKELIKALESVRAEDKRAAAFISTVKHHLSHLHKAIMMDSAANNDVAGSFDIAIDRLISKLHDFILRENENLDNTSANSTNTAREQDGVRRGLVTVSKDEMMHDASTTTALVLFEQMIMDLSKLLVEDEEALVVSLGEVPTNKQDSYYNAVVLFAIYFILSLFVYTLVFLLIIVTFPISVPILILIVIAVSYCLFVRPDNPTCEKLFNDNNNTADGNDERMLLKGQF